MTPGNGERMISSCSRLDRGDDVLHASRAGPVQGSQEGSGSAEGPVAQDQLARTIAFRALLGHARLRPVGARCPACAADCPVWAVRAVCAVGTAPGNGEPLVLHPDNRSAVEGQMAPEHETLGVTSGGPVKRLGHRSPPVDDQGLVIGAVHRQPADVEHLGPQFTVGAPARVGLAVGAPARVDLADVGLAGVGLAGPSPAGIGPVARGRAVLIAHDAVDSPEGQGLIADVELLEPGQAGADDHVPLGAGLERPTFAEVKDPLEHAVGVRAHGVEARIGQIHELLFCLQLALDPHRHLLRDSPYRLRGTYDSTPPVRGLVQDRPMTAPRLGPR